MELISDVAVSRGDLGRRQAEQDQDLAEVRTARRGQHTSIGQDGLRFHSLGSATFEDGGGVEVNDGGNIEVNDGGNIFIRGGGTMTVEGGTRIIARYPLGSAAAYFGEVLSGDGSSQGYGLLVQGETGPDVFRAREHPEFGRQVVIGETGTAVDQMLVYADEVDIGTVSTPASEVSVITDNGDIGMIAQNSGQAFFGGHSGTFVFPQSSAGTANVIMDTGTGELTYVSSTERVKRDVRDLDVDESAVLRLRPRSWLPGPTRRQCPPWMHERHADGECHSGEVVEPPEDARREVGFVAEELDELGLGDFVEYDEDGRPSSIRYDRVSAALIPVVQQQQDQIDELSRRLDAVERSARTQS